MRLQVLLGLVLGLLMLLPGKAHAQVNCPPGWVPYATGNDLSACGPDNIQPQQPSQRQQLQAPQRPPERWQDHWGAVATDIPNKSVGTAANLSSQSGAEKAAVSDCQSKGGSTCKIEIAYRNGCTALAAGNTGHNAKANTTIDAASQAAMRVCSAADANCKIYYTACSLPVRIQ